MSDKIRYSNPIGEYKDETSLVIDIGGLDNGTKQKLVYKINELVCTLGASWYFGDINPSEEEEEEEIY